MSRVITAGGPEGGATGIRALLAVAAYADISWRTTAALFASVKTLSENGIDADLEIYTGNCHVDDSRNRLVRDFLMGDYTDLVFIDADVGWLPSALVRILSVDRDIAAGVYSLKSDDGYPVRTLPGDIRADADGMVEVAGVPTGFLRIRRHVLETTIKGRPTFPTKNSKEGEPWLPLLFERTIGDGARWGGDYEFCRRARAAGFKIYVDPELHFDHVGQTVWSGSLGDYWRDENGINDYHIGEVIKKIQNGTADIGDFARLHEEWDNPWAASPSMLYACYQAAQAATGPILETGSGLTTIVMAAATDQPVISLEHEAGWLVKTQEALDKHHLDNARLWYHPLKNYGDFTWYVPPPVPTEFALVVCDGPQRKHGREGLFKVMSDRIRSAPLFMDDVEDPIQAELIDTWAKAEGREVVTIEGERPFAISMPAKAA